MILIVDDDSAVRLSIGLVAERCGFTPVEASTESAAVSVYFQKQYISRVVCFLRKVPYARPQVFL